MKTIANNKNFPAVWEEHMRVMSIVLSKAHEEENPVGKLNYHAAVAEAKNLLCVLDCIEAKEQE